CIEFVGIERMMVPRERNEIADVSCVDGSPSRVECGPSLEIFKILVRHLSLRSITDVDMLVTVPMLVLIFQGGEEKRRRASPVLAGIASHEDCQLVVIHLLTTLVNDVHIENCNACIRPLRVSQPGDSHSQLNRIAEDYYSGCAPGGLENCH